MRAGLQPGEPLPKGMPIPGSENMHKTHQRIARLHARIANIRVNAWRQLTTMLVERFEVVTIEDRNVEGMLHHPQLARQIADKGFGALRRQLEYKAVG